MTEDNNSLGKFHFDGIPPAPRGLPQVEVTFDILCGSFSSPVLGSQDAKPASPVVTLGVPLNQRNAGVSVNRAALRRIDGRHGKEPIHEGGSVHVHALRRAQKQFCQ